MALLSTVWKITRFLSENPPPFCENTQICTEQLDRKLNKENQICNLRLSLMKKGF